MGAESKAEDYLQQGEKALKRFSIFSSSASKYEDASDCFEKAGNQFKIAKKWQEAADAYRRSAECQVKLKESARAAHFYQSAADAMKKLNPEEAISMYKQVIAMLCDSGRFSSAAKIQKEIAEIYESKENFEEALENYKQAADYFQGENQTSSANNMLLKVAQFSAQLGRYETAMELYIEVAKNCMDSNLLKFNAKGHLLNAGLCVLATKDIVLVQQKWEEFTDIDYTFAESREGKFLESMNQCFQNYDPDGFADAVFQFDRVSKLEPWKISLLLKVKESISSGMNETEDLT